MPLYSPSSACAVRRGARPGAGGAGARPSPSADALLECWPPLPRAGPHRRHRAPRHGEEVKSGRPAEGGSWFASASLGGTQGGHPERFAPPTQVRVSVNRTVVLEEPVGQLRALWEETSFQLERLQAKPHCVAQEEQGLRERAGPTYCLPPTFPRASVPCEPGEGVCAEAWLPWHCGPWGGAWSLDVGSCPGQGV